MNWLVIVSIIWGLSFGLIGNTLAGLPSGYVSAVRLLLCFIVFLPFMRKASPRTVLGLVAIGAIQFGFMYLLYIESFKYMKSYEVAIFTIFTPVYVTLFNDILRRKLSWRHLTAAGFAVLGAGVILWRNEAGIGEVGKGFVILQLSNLCFAVGQLLYAKWKKPFIGHRETSLFGWLYLGSVIAVLPFVGIGQWQSGWEHTTGEQWGALLYLGIVASGLSFFMWNHGARMVAPARLAVMNNLKIPMAALFSIVVFGESFSLWTVGVGMLLFVVSIFMSGEKRVK